MKRVLLKPKQEYLDLFFETYAEVCDNSRFEESKQHIQHGDTSVYEHSISVAYMAMCMAIRLKHTTHLKELIRAGLLHDYFLYDWHEKNAGHELHGFYHPGMALRNAMKDFVMSKRERLIIKRHMFPLTVIPPTSVEAYLVCLADKICSMQETFHARITKRRFRRIMLEASKWRQKVPVSDM